MTADAERRREAGRRWYTPHRGRQVTGGCSGSPRGRRQTAAAGGAQVFTELSQPTQQLTSPVCFLDFCRALTASRERRAEGRMDSAHSGPGKAPSAGRPAQGQQEPRHSGGPREGGLLAQAGQPPPGSGQTSGQVPAVSVTGQSHCGGPSQMTPRNRGQSVPNT